MNTVYTSAELPEFLKILAHEVRWKVLAALARSDYAVQEMIRFLDQPANLVSYHLRKLRDARLVTERRSSADARDIFYSLDFETLRALYLSTGAALHPALGNPKALTDTYEWHFPQAQTPPRVLFLCTENSARSQMAEGLLRHLSRGRVEAYSAGSHPSTVHPSAIRAMAAVGIDISQQQAKHFDEFRHMAFDRIVTVCDRVREVCPTFPEDPEHIHWSFSDPATVEGSEEVKYRAFEQTALQLTTRIRYMLTLLEREKGGAL